ncbi:hypothetical protein BDD12DRAFT_350729 [Trichophaea hybrida]|nr:hypothetical protein BDD12DRAFT_350729 [Trichophaea hybrida]
MTYSKNRSNTPVQRERPDTSRLYTASSKPLSTPSILPRSPTCLLCVLVNSVSSPRPRLLRLLPYCAPSSTPSSGITYPSRVTSTTAGNYRTTTVSHLPSSLLRVDVYGTNGDPVSIRNSSTGGSSLTVCCCLFILYLL